MDTENLLTRVAENLSVRRVFGTAYEKDGLLIIPVAVVVGGGGGGEGPTPPPRRSPQTEGRLTEAPPGVAPGSEGGMALGSGGGFGGLVLPVGTYVVKGDDVRWVPAVNVTVIVLALLSVVRLFMRLRTRVRVLQLAHTH